MGRKLILATFVALFVYGTGQLCRGVAMGLGTSVRLQVAPVAFLSALLVFAFSQ